MSELPDGPGELCGPEESQPEPGEWVLTSLEGLNLEVGPDRAVATLCRPEVRNAIDVALVRSLHEVCGRLEDQPLPLILTGGPDLFASGADIGELRDRTRADALTGINSRVFDRVANLPLPTVAAISGYALGGGAELAYACDFRIATQSVTIGNPEGQLGILAAAGAAWRLKELVGDVLAKEIMLAGRTLDASEALAARLVNEVVAVEDLLGTAHAWIDRILRAAPLALRLAKLALRMPREAHPEFDNVAQAVLFETQDKYDRMDAFLNRRRQH